MRILNRYIRYVVISATVLVALTLVGIESFMEFIGELHDLGRGGYDIFHVFAYVGMQLPFDIY